MEAARPPAIPTIANLLAEIFRWKIRLKMKPCAILYYDMHKSLIIAMHRKYTYEYHSPLLCSQDHMCNGKMRVCLDRSRVCMDCHCTSPHLELIWYSMNHLDYFLFGNMCIHLKPLSKRFTILSWNIDVCVHHL